MDSRLNETDVADYAQDLLLETQDVGDFLNELARYSADNLSGPRGQVHCGITLLRRRSAAAVDNAISYVRQASKTLRRAVLLAQHNDTASKKSAGGGSLTTHFE